MRYATRGVHPCLTASLRAHLYSLFYLQCDSAPSHAARVCCGDVQGKGSYHTGWTIPGVMRSLALTAVLLTVFGCAGVWEGSIRVAPSIIVQPTGQSATAGLTATLTVTATGTGPLSYQWYKGGVAISGANSSSYTTPATATSDNGAVFTVAVWNTVGRVTSVPASLTVTLATLQSIAVTPANPSIAKGLTKQFTATGTYSEATRRTSRRA
jgi:hypothetical protein